MADRERFAFLQICRELRPCSSCASLRRRLRKTARRGPECGDSLFPNTLILEMPLTKERENISCSSFLIFTLSWHCWFGHAHHFQLSWCHSPSINSCLFNCSCMRFTHLLTIAAIGKTNFCLLVFLIYLWAFSRGVSQSLVPNRSEIIWFSLLKFNFRLQFDL